ncbi:MAG: hypothetical protein NZM35_10585 [Chitinophagales bacterium]|nr:hypothetical protein [Chitinophagales bacterium]MDW8419259.1 hypothetical protein [Chitinophagales bacterium]
MEDIISAIGIFFGSIIKFSLATITALESDLGLGGSIANIIGGIIGIVIFTYLGTFIQDYFVKKFPKKFGRKFTPTNRFLVRVKQRFGLGGIAVLTPIALSIPVGVLFATTLTHDKRKIILSMVLSALFWAVVISLPYYLFGVSITDTIAKIFGR